MLFSSDIATTDSVVHDYEIYKLFSRESEINEKLFISL
jgi:hypothetical protein